MENIKWGELIDAVEELRLAYVNATVVVKGNWLSEDGISDHRPGGWSYALIVFCSPVVEFTAGDAMDSQSK